MSQVYYYMDRPCWHCMAHEHHYENPKSMLKGMYHVHGMNATQIAEKLDRHVTTIRARLRFYGITNNQWGGKREY